MTEDWKNGGFGLYIHWPFCQSKCPYCDFNSHVSANIDQDRWRRAYLSEIGRVAALTPDRVLNSIFFGGGTPSLMEPDLVADIIQSATSYWTPANDIEITLEANPSSVEAGRFRGYRDGGVNRISMGIQALNDEDLRKLGRLHSVAEAKAAFQIARGVFDRVSFDLIYARQDQSLSDWRDELSQALAMSVDHLSLYQLTIEAGTAFGDRYKHGKLRGLPDDDQSADMFDLTQETCDVHGFPGYEISNHARPGSESRHNLIYWRYGDYAGIGPGAHGRLTLSGQRHSTEAYHQPGAWLNAVETHGDGSVSVERLSIADQTTEFLLMGMRLSEGIDQTRFEHISGSPLHPAAIERLVDLGLLGVEGRLVRATPKGRPILNALLRELLGGD